MAKNSKETVVQYREVTRVIHEKYDSVEFGGVLLKEEEDALYVGDVQGTWVVSRGDVIELLEWALGPEVVPASLLDRGRPVRVKVRRGAVVHELRPWKIGQESIVAGTQIRHKLGQVFSLGAASREAFESSIGVERLADLERTFARHLGWDPDRRRSDGGVAQRMPVTGTYIQQDGYCDRDQDWPF